MAEKTIIVGGASKSFSWTGGRIGWAMFPTVDEAEVFKNLNINFFSCVAAYNQEGCRLGLESPLFAAENRKMIDAFQARRDLVVEGLQRDPRHSLPDAERGLLCLSERLGRVRVTWNPGRVSAGSRTR